MLTEQFYTQLATLVKSEPRNGGSLYFAIGQGQAQWDTAPPLLRRDRTALTRELIRKAVVADDIDFLNEAGAVSKQASPRLRVKVSFGAGEGSGTLRECGLLLGNGRDAILLAYFIHSRFEKQDESILERSIQLDLRPGKILAQEISTRYLGNAKTEELHDVENENAACQLNEIRIDRRHYFNNINDALNLGYDYCAYCFGRELSER